MIHNEYRLDDAVLRSEDIDLDAGTITIWEDGETTTRPLTADEVQAYTPPPPEVPAPDVLIASIAQMDDAQKAALREALGL